LKNIFILGCERSGSTWLANIFDAHSDVSFYMEPFADYAALFPSFPARNIYIDESLKSDFQEQFGLGLKNIAKIKYGLVYKPGMHPLYRKVDIKYYSFINKWLKKGKVYPSQKLLQYHLLNLNVFSNPLLLSFKKSKKNNTRVIKELRLNFKVRLLNEVFPDCKVLVTIRNPIDQIQSIVKLIEQGHLGELHKNLLVFSNSLIGNKRFKKYESELEAFNSFSLIEKLAVWWLINYEVLIEDLKTSKISYKIVYHENLTHNTLDLVGECFSFCETAIHSNVNQYINHSTTFQSEASSPINTDRKSDEYYKQKSKNQHTLLIKKNVENTLSRFDLVDEIASQYLQIF